jgi:nucleoside-diphosphate-sugar epimerase
VRLVLDAHISDRHIARRLRERGHDVVALHRDEELAALPDAEVLRFAARERRILVTHNVRHSAPLLRQWAEAGESHAGCILVTLPHGAYGAILRRLDAAVAARPRPRDWADVAVIV